MLNPLVRDLSRLKVPRALSVTIVYATFAATVTALLIAIGAVAFDQARKRPSGSTTTSRTRTPERGQTEAERDIDGLQACSTTTGRDSRSASRYGVDRLAWHRRVSGYAQEGITFAQGAVISVVLLLFSAS